MSTSAYLRSLRSFTQCSCSMRIASLDVNTQRAILTFVRSKSTKATRLQPTNTSASQKAPSLTNAAKLEVGPDSTPGARALRSGTGKVTEIEQETLPWADYLAIRKRKRRWETVRLLCTRLMYRSSSVALLLPEICT